MGKPKVYLFNNRFTGDVVPATIEEGAKLGEDWSRIKPVKNERGETVLRMQLHGATVDISEREVQESVNRKSK